jgi:hypothetical protein
MIDAIDMRTTVAFSFPLAGRRRQAVKKRSL